MARIFLMIAAILGGLGVASGAFGSHALKASLSERALDIFEVATRYQFIHALAIGWVGILLNQGNLNASRLIAAGTAFTLGVLIFSGSLYALSLTNMGILGAITPIGGVAMIIGWICLAAAAWSLK